jgi:hypothetical protein
MVIDTSKLTSGSWKTTVLGLISAAATFIVANPDMFSKWPWLRTVAVFVMTGGLAGLGLTAKDSSVTGGTKANPTNDPAAVAATAVPKPTA